MATFGNACSDRASQNSATHQTVFDRVTPATEDGVITSVCVYHPGGTGTEKVKVFRTVGSDYVCIGESSPQAVAGGSNTFSGLSIPFLAGDFIGVYFEEITYMPGVDSDTTAGAGSLISGDISSLAISSWVNFTGTLSILATYTPNLNDVYVNTSTGNDTYAGDSCSSGHPVSTFAKAYELLNTGGTIHVCNSGADFSAETVTRNKSYNMDLNGSSGYFYGAKGA